MLLIFIMMVASACSAAFENAGLSADDAALLSGALAVDPVTATFDFNYTVNFAFSADGEMLSITTAGRGIQDAASGNSLLSMAGELSGSDFGGEPLPYDLEIRTIGTTDVYVRGLAPLVNPTYDDNQWLYLDSQASSQMAMATAPELQGSGLVTDGSVDVAAIYSALNNDFFATAANHIQATRLDDMGGQAHFQVDLLIGDWLSSEELETGLQSLIPTLAGGLVPDEEIQSNMAQATFALGMAGMVLSDGTYQFDYFVDPASGLLTGAMMTIAIEIDPAMFGEEGDPVIVDILLDVNLNVPGSMAVEAPEDFIDLMAMMGGG